MGKLPARRKGSKLGAAMPDAVKEAEATFFRCPKGHKLPNRTKTGECTPLFCGASSNVKASGDLKKPPPTREKATALAAAPDLADGEQAVESARLVRAQAREKTRREFLNVPSGLAGADAEEYVERKLSELAPIAVAELEYRLRLGSDDQRYDAALKALEATGHGKKEKGGGAPQVIIIGGDSSSAKSIMSQLPWNRPAQQTIEAQPVKELPDASK